MEYGFQTKAWEEGILQEFGIGEKFGIQEKS